MNLGVDTLGPYLRYTLEEQRQYQRLTELGVRIVTQTLVLGLAEKRPEPGERHPAVAHRRRLVEEALGVTEPAVRVPRELGERLRLAHRQIGQHLAVDRHDVLASGKPVHSGREEGPVVAVLKVGVRGEIVEQGSGALLKGSTRTVKGTEIAIDVRAGKTGQRQFPEKSAR